MLSPGNVEVHTVVFSVVSPKCPFTSASFHHYIADPYIVILMVSSIHLTCHLEIINLLTHREFIGQQR